MKNHRGSLATRAVHAGAARGKTGAAVTPIYLSTVWELDRDPASYTDILYPRLQNLPGQRVVQEKIAALEGGGRAVVAASGMAAIATTLLDTATPGGHVLVQRQVYGGSFSFLSHEAQRYGLSHTFVEGTDPLAWDDAVRPETRAIFVESMSNPLLRVLDHRAVVSFAKRHGLVSIIDNTFLTPMHFRPLEAGYDVVVYSGTKYLNGHSDLVAGAVVCDDARAESIHRRLIHLGGSLDPQACFLLERGLKTLALRMERHHGNATELAHFLDEHDSVERVHHPSLPSHPDHTRARKLFDGYGGMLSFVPRGGPDAAARLCRAVTVPVHGPSLGGVETLVARPARTSHAGISPEERAAMGVGDDLIRMSVGIESADDLKEDLDRALAEVSRTASA